MKYNSFTVEMQLCPHYYIQNGSFLNTRIIPGANIICITHNTFSVRRQLCGFCTSQQVCWKLIFTLHQIWKFHLYSV